MGGAEHSITSHYFLSETRRCAPSAILDVLHGGGGSGTGCDSELACPMWEG